MRFHTMMQALILLLSMMFNGAAAAQIEINPLQTVAESSDFTETATHAQVQSLIEQIASSSEVASVIEMGMTTEGRSISMLVLADPPVTNPDEIDRTSHAVVFLMGGIHAGEVCGKEALLMLAREIATAPEHPLLKDLVILIAPLYNADGNERFAKDNRPGQVGPTGGMGERPNAQGLDLNRDYIKLETPEARAQVRMLREWDPAVFVDTHTTNGSKHRYTLTYASPKNPAGDEAVLEYARDTMLPGIAEATRDADGWDTFWYGNFNNDHTVWGTYPALGRYGANYRGLRNRISILTEAYAYASYKDRVLATRDFCRQILVFSAEHRSGIGDLIKEADKRTTSRGKDPSEDDFIAIRSELVGSDEPITVKGYGKKEQGDDTGASDEPVDYEVTARLNFEPVVSVRRPYAYLVPAGLTGVVENLQRHGVEVKELREDILLDVQVYRVDSIVRSENVFEGHKTVRVKATAIPQSKRVPAGTLVVSMGQKLGDLAAYLLEPESEDGLCTWNYFDDALAEGGTGGEGGEYPVWRITDPITLMLAEPRPLADEAEVDLPITFELLYESKKKPSFGGSPVGGLRWLEDGKRYLQVRGGKLVAVDAQTGRAEPYFDEKAIGLSIAQLPMIDEKTAGSISRRTRPTLNKDHSAMMFTHENDLYIARTDGSQSERLTATPEREELGSFSPDGSLIAYVRENDLWVVDTLSATNRALTTGGTDTLRHGKADWVYYEEVIGRDWRTYWWSPDSKRLAFLETSDPTVPVYTIVNDNGDTQILEQVRYPRPGEVNPSVRLGMVTAAGGSVKWIDLSDYDAGAFIIKRVNWLPDGKALIVQIQDREQTWLDLVRVGIDGTSRRLMRETTQAWVDERDLHFLDDGSFVMISERTGWAQLYQFNKDGELIGPITEGEWEVRSISHIDRENEVIYFTGTRDSHTAMNLYRVTIADADELSEPERLTTDAGSHRVSVSPDAEMFVDSWSTPKNPRKVALRSMEGSLIRMIDTNPNYERLAYREGKHERFTITTEDGFQLEASLLYPPEFDASRKYPVWFMTYGGPHTPTVYDSWSRSWAWDRLLGEQDVIVFRADPRSASGKGAVSAWTTYRNLGVQEMADIKEAINWLKAKPFVDGDRIGMSGHSYGGFMTAYAMTHSDLFAAGIAGAPVTSWREYDSIYTERFMGTPQNNPEGYEQTSVIDAAKDLHGKLMILHGTLDDNVHTRNSILLVQALQKANKPFEMMLYPGYRHGIWGKHYRTLMYEFIMRTIGTGWIEGEQLEESVPSEADSLPEAVEPIQGPGDGSIDSD